MTVRPGPSGPRPAHSINTPNTAESRRFGPRTRPQQSRQRDSAQSARMARIPGHQQVGAEAKAGHEQTARAANRSRASSGRAFVSARVDGKQQRDRRAQRQQFSAAPPPARPPRDARQNHGAQHQRGTVRPGEPPRLRQRARFLRVVSAKQPAEYRRSRPSTPEARYSQLCNLRQPDEPAQTPQIRRWCKAA